jgi:hypothetical protein
MPDFSNVLGLTVGLARLDGLASLFDLLEDGVVGKRIGGGDLGGLGLEGDVVRFNTCKVVRICCLDRRCMLHAAAHGYCIGD